MKLLKNGIYSTTVKSKTNTFNKYGYLIILNQKEIIDDNGYNQTIDVAYHYEFSTALTNNSLQKIVSNAINENQLLKEDCLYMYESILKNMIDGYLGKCDEQICNKLQEFYQIE